MDQPGRHHTDRSARLPGLEGGRHPKVHARRGAKSQDVRRVPRVGTHQRHGHLRRQRPGRRHRVRRRLRQFRGRGGRRGRHMIGSLAKSAKPVTQQQLKNEANFQIQFVNIVPVYQKHQPSTRRTSNNYQQLTIWFRFRTGNTCIVLYFIPI